MPTISEEIVNFLITKNLTIATCESLTGGLIASQLTSITNASMIFKGGLVTYSNHAKNTLANVSEQLLNDKGAISSEVASAMALGVQKKLKTDLAIAITGNAGPSAQEDKPIGLAYLCIRVVDQTYNYVLRAQATERNAIRMELGFLALDHLLALLNKMNR
jgi:PncC family amidohydrolase